MAKSLSTEKWKYWLRAYLRLVTKFSGTPICINVTIFQSLHLFTKQSGSLCISPELWSRISRPHILDTPPFQLRLQVTILTITMFYFILSSLSLTLVLTCMVCSGQIKYKKMHSKVPISAPLELELQNMVT